jgi:polyhydroxybutyrate depolymerase
MFSSRGVRSLSIALLITTCISVATIAKTQSNVRVSQAIASDIEGSFTYQNIQRTYLLHLPSNYQAGKTYPLVLAFHGGGGTSNSMKKLTGFNRVADQAGFIVAYPAGYQGYWADGRPESPAAQQGIDDVGFVSQLVDTLVQEYGVDPKRVYATGISNGGNFSQRLGCELANQITAIAVVAAGMPSNLADTCQPARPVPMTLIFGTDDPIYPFAGGSTSLGSVLAVEAAVAKRVQLNNCSTQPQVTQLPNRAPFDRTRIQRSAYGNCTDGAAVDYYWVEGGGHTWPGGLQYLPPQFIGKTSRDMDASHRLWAFFKQFQRM